MRLRAIPWNAIDFDFIQSLYARHKIPDDKAHVAYLLLGVSPQVSRVKRAWKMKHQELYDDRWIFVLETAIQCGLRRLADWRALSDAGRAAIMNKLLPFTRIKYGIDMEGCLVVLNQTGPIPVEYKSSDVAEASTAVVTTAPTPNRLRLGAVFMNAAREYQEHELLAAQQELLAAQDQLEAESEEEHIEDRADVSPQTLPQIYNETNKVQTLRMLSHNLQIYTSLMEKYSRRIAGPINAEQHIVRAAARCSATALDLLEQARDMVGRSSKHPRPVDDNDGDDGDGDDGDGGDGDNDNDHHGEPPRKRLKKNPE